MVERYTIDDRRENDRTSADVVIQVVAMSPVDAMILVAFVVYAATAGLRERRRASRGLEEYFLAGRSLPGWAAGISMAATQFAADTPLLATGLIATAGVFALWRLWIYALAFLLLGFVLAPCWRRAAVLTDAELTELRYGGRAAAALRAIKAIYFGTVFNCTVLAMVLFAAREITEPFLMWNVWLPAGLFDGIESGVRALGVPLARTAAHTEELGLWTRSTNNAISLAAIVGVTALYSTTGGLRSVVRTDLAQFAIMMVATAGYAWFVVDEAGGLDAIAGTIRDRFAAPGPNGLTADEILAFTPSHAADASAAVLAVLGLQWLVQMNADGTGYLAQRVMACRSDRDASQAAVVFTVAQVLLRSLVWLPIGLGLLVIFPIPAAIGPDALTAEREATFVRGMAELLPPGLAGLMLTAMLAALASTVDTHLNWGASYWTNDLYKRFVCEGWLGREPSARSLVWVARASNLVILLLGLAIMTRLSSIQVAWQVSLLMGAGMGVVLVLRWLWWRVNALGELTAVLASMVLAPVLLLGLPGQGEATRLLLMALGATLAGVVVSLATRPDAPEVLDRFYLRVQPPGFWAPSAARAGDDPRRPRQRLVRGAAATLAAAASVFCLLTGVGSRIARSPVPVPIVTPAVWTAVLIVVAVGLALLAWRFATPAAPGVRSRT